MTTTRQRNLRIAESWLSKYWLCHSEGFRVDTVDGEHAGYVEDVVWSQDGRSAEKLVVRCGFEGDCLFAVGIDDVVEVRPRASCLVIGSRATV